MSLFLITLLSFCINRVDLQSVDQYYRSALFEKYDKTVRPDELVYIRVKLALQKIVALDEKNQVVTSSSFLFASWVDKRLQFNASYNFAINVPLKQLWIPDFYVLNTAETNGYLTINENSYGYIYPSFGLVTINLGLLGLRTRCTIDMYKYPYDRQTCSIVIGSWFQDHYRVRFTLELINRSDLIGYVKNSLWHLEKTSSEMITSNSRFLKFTYNNDFYYNFTVKRQPFYFMVSNVYPCFVTSSLILLAYMFPFNIQAYLSFGILLVMGFMSIKLSNDVPSRSESLPLILQFYILNYLYLLVSFVWFCTAEATKTDWIERKFISNILRRFRKRNLCLIEVKSKEQQINTIHSKQFAELEIDLTNMNVFVFVFISLAMISSYFYIFVLIVN